MNIPCTAFGALLAYFAALGARSAQDAWWNLYICQECAGTLVDWREYERRTAR